MFFPSVKSAYRVIRQIELDTVLVQMFTGHGGFSEYLHRFKLKESPACPCDPEVDQTVVHILLSCPLFGRERADLELKIGIRLDTGAVASLMSEDESRRIFMEYCKKVTSENMSVITESIDLEREYSPSMWSTRFSSAHEVLHHHVQFVTAASEKATNNIPHKLEIEYGSTSGQKLDIFGTDLPNDSPILVYIHGGYWQELSREVSRYPALSLYRSRIKTIVVDYDLCPEVTLPEIVHQIENAARFVFEYAEKMDSRGVYFAGHSAGAHLVAKLLANADFFENNPGSHRLQGAFLVSGVYDLRELVHTSVNNAVQLPHEWAAPLSPLFDSYTHLQTRRIRIYILAAQNDSPTFKKQSREFFELLHNTCLMQHMYLEIKDDLDHFDIVECLAQNDNYLKNILIHDVRKHL